MDGEVIRSHLPCPDCGSSDALTEYTNGTYCFSCEKFTPADKVKPQSVQTQQQHKHKNLIPLDECEIQALTKRGLTQATCRKYGYYTSEVGGTPCQVACYFSDDGELLGQKIRYPDKHFSVYGNLHHRFFGQHLWANGHKLVITEGEIDCLTVSQVGGNKWPVVSIPNGAQSAKKVFTENMEWLNRFDEVIVMFDMDEAGRKAVESVCNILPPGKLYIANLPLKDPNECLKAGRAKEIIDAIFQAKPYRPDGIINGSELWEELRDEPDEAAGYPLPWDIPLQQMTAGLRKGELVVITAGTGIGKTTFVRQIAYHFGVHLGLKVGMMMLEENVKRTAKGLMAVHAGKRLSLNKNLVSPEEYKKIFEETLGGGNFVFYQHFGSMESDSLMAKMRYLAVAEQCDFIVLDHITIAISGLDIENERKATDVLMTNLRSLCEETGVGMLIISHLKRTDGQSAEEGGVISLSHLRGSHALAQLSDTVVALERNQQADDPDEKNLVRLRVLKNRHTGETGLAGYLKYDKETDRLEAAEKKKTSLADAFKEEADNEDF
ncbi:MAG: topoisomerase [Phascolarctobacterium sp.]|nr:MAG: topoisomerase [Phascolarctobacterium sp.]